MFYFDPLFLLFALPGLVLALLAQILVWAAYASYSRVDAATNLTGAMAADLINTNEGFNVEIFSTPGRLNDYYNPVTNKVNISSDNMTNSSVANIAVVAHEFGHVEQKHSASILFGIRTAMVPAVNIGSNIGYILIIIGLALAFSGLAWLGVILFSFTALFALVTLPIELDASRRGLQLIKKYKLIDSTRLGGARTVLLAAALTYFAALVQSLGQLLYFVMLVSGNSRDQS